MSTDPTQMTWLGTDTVKACELNCTTLIWPGGAPVALIAPEPRVGAHV